MSETATQLNTKAELAGWCRRLGGMYAKDLDAIDEVHYDACISGKARSIAEFTSEVCGFSLLVAGGLRGDAMEMPDDAAREAYKSQFTNKAFAMQTIVSSSNALADAFESCTDDDLASQTAAPWGEPMTKFALANISINHIMYHDAQLNYIQSLQGDGEMHWFDHA